MDLLSVSFGIFFWHTVALLCVFFLLKRFAFKTILESLEQRRKKIDESIAYSQLLEGEIKNIEKIRNEQIQCLKEEKNKTLEEIKNIREKLFSETKKEAQDLREVLIKKAQEEAEQLKIRMKFFELVIKNNRSEYILPIIKSFCKKYEEYEHIGRVKLYAAGEISKENKEKIITLLKNKFGFLQVYLSIIIDKSLIGGFVAYVNDNKYDCSIKNSLNKLSKKFNTNL